MKIKFKMLRIIIALTYVVKEVMAAQPASVPETLNGRDWMKTANAVVSGNNVEYLTGMTFTSCIQACIDAVPPAKNYDCWSVEFIRTACATCMNCRT